MRSLAFLLSRRWIGFAVVVVLLAYLAWWLGGWQFDRLDERRAANSVVQHNEVADPVPVADVLAPGRAVDPGDEWRLVSATGTYDADNTIVVRYQTNKRASGIDVVVPLVTDDGPALLVNRGWLATENQGAASLDDVPDPPTGEVHVQAWVRADATGSSIGVTDQSTRAVSSEAIGDALGIDVYGGWAELKSEDPPPATPLTPVELPDLGEGPHFFYGLQWWFFGLLAIGGFLYLAYDEWRVATGRRPPRTAGSRRRTSEPSLEPAGDAEPDRERRPAG